MYKSVLIAATALMVFSGAVSAQLVYDGGSTVDPNDVFDEANWVDTTTGLDPAPDTVNPSTVQIAADLTIGGAFNPVSTVNIRLDDGFTLTLQDNATLSSLVYSAGVGEVANFVVTDDAVMTVTQNIARSEFDVSGNATILFTGAAPEFTTDSLNLSSTWTGSIELVTATPRSSLLGGNGVALFNTLTIDGVAATNDDIVATDVLDETGAVVGISFSLAATDCLLGDVNQDSIVNFLDISPFIGVLSSGGDFQCEADINEDNVVSFLDIAPFIGVLSGP